MGSGWNLMGRAPGLPPDQYGGWKALSIVGPAGPTGEVTSQAMIDAISAAIPGTPSNVNTIAPLSLTVSNPPTQTEMQAVVDKLNDLIAALKRV